MTAVAGEFIGPLLREVLGRESGEAVLVVSSHSMAPRLAKGDRIVVKAVPPASLRPGDVIVFESEETGLVVHRLIWRDRPLRRPMRIYTRGDALDRLDRSVPVDRVLGRVESVLREGSRFRPTRLTDRLSCCVHAAGLGFRRWIRRTLARVRRNGWGGG